MFPPTGFEPCGNEQALDDKRGGDGPPDALRRRLPRPVDGDTQGATLGAFDLDQVVTQAADGLLDDLL